MLPAGVLRVQAKERPSNADIMFSHTIFQRDEKNERTRIAQIIFRSCPSQYSDFVFVTCARPGRLNIKSIAWGSRLAPHGSVLLTNKLK